MLPTRQAAGPRRRKIRPETKLAFHSWVRGVPALPARSELSEVPRLLWPRRAQTTRNTGLTLHFWVTSPAPRTRSGPRDGPPTGTKPMAAWHQQRHSSRSCLVSGHSSTADRCEQVQLLPGTRPTAKAETATSREPGGRASGVRTHTKAEKQPQNPPREHRHSHARDSPQEPNQTCQSSRPHAGH